MGNKQNTSQRKLGKSYAETLMLTFLTKQLSDSFLSSCLFDGLLALWPYIEIQDKPYPMKQCNADR